MIVGARSQEPLGLRMGRTVVLCVCLVGVCLGASTAWAQLPTATILGVVKDSSGAVVPEAKMTARSTETGQTRTTVSGADGAYRFPGLPVGGWEIWTEHAGFQTEIRSGVTLTVSQEAVVNVTLQVGGVEQTVAVTAEAPLVNTTSGALGGLVSAEKMAELPLNGRNYIDLTLLQMGVAEQKAGGSKGNAGFSGTYFSSNGAPIRSNNYLLDGAIMMNAVGATSGSASNSTLGVEGIREFRVVTNSFSAEYGMTMGSQMIIVSKGGSNSFHGSVFEYLRDSALDQPDYFHKPVAANNFVRIPAFRRNNFGGAFGGPLKRDKTFFFGVFEGVKERKGITKIDNVMPAACHTANSIVDNQACLGSATPGTTTVAPVIRPLLALYPVPNLPNNQYTFPYTQPTTDRFGQLRVDQNFSNEDTLFARYTIQDTSQSVVQAFPTSGTDNKSRSQFATVSESHVFSPTLLNTFRASFSKSVLDYQDWATIPSGPLYSITAGWPMKELAVGGYTTNGSQGTFPFLRTQSIFTFSDDVFSTHGRHFLKFGFLLNRFENFGTGNAPKGRANFPNLTAFLTARPNQVTSVAPDALLSRTFHYNSVGFYGQDDIRLGNLTLNVGLRYEFLTVPQEESGQWGALRDLANDAQFTVSSELYGKNPSLKNFSPRLGFAWDVRGDGKTALRGGWGLLYDIGNIGGMMFQSLSGNPPLTNQVSVNSPAVFTIPFNYPTSAAQAFPRPTDYHMGQPHLYSYNLTLERQLPFAMAVTLAYTGSMGMDLAQVREGNTAIPQGIPVNGSCVARPAGQAINDASMIDGSATACWLGARSAANPQGLVGGDPRRNPNWGSLDLFTSGVNSWYNGLQVGLNKRVTHGLQFQSSYTWSRARDQNPGYSNAEQTPTQSSHAVDPDHPDVDKGPSILDIPHVWRFNAIYRIPRFTTSGGVAGRLASGLFNGWWTSGILTLQSGLPFTVALNTNRSRSAVQAGGGGNDRPNLVPGRTSTDIVSGVSAGCGTGLTRAQGGTAIAPGTPLGTASLYYDPCAFSVPAAGFLGNVGRNFLRGPGYVGLDLTLAKDVTAIKRLGDNGAVQFRIEIFNVFNRVNLESPNRIVLAGTAVGQNPLANAGIITSTLGTSRQIQLALKVLF